MRSRAALGASVLVVVALLAWVMARGGPGTTAASTPPSPPPAVAPAPAASATPTVETRRNVFRFADEPRADEAGPSGASARRRAVEARPTPVPDAGPRLVGLVRRGDRLVAAFAAADGEVELAGPGETAGGVVVLAIGEDSVRIRRPDGTETTLPLP